MSKFNDHARAPSKLVLRQGRKMSVYVICKRLIHRSVVSAILLCSADVSLAAAGVPAFKLTSPEGAESTLIGSVHIPMEGLSQPGPAMLNGARRLVIEGSSVVGPQPPKPSPEGLLVPGAMASRVKDGSWPRAAWAKGLSDAELDQLRRNAECSKTPVPVDLLMSFRSPMVAASIAFNPCRKPGQLSRDEILDEAAKRYNVTTEILETQVAAQKQREAVPDRLYEEALHAGLHMRARDSFRAIVVALNNGDYAAVTRVVDATYRDPADAALVQRLMIRERNLAWIPVMRRFLDEGHAVVIVGAAHLPGPTGLIALLKAARYRVETIELPAAGGRP